MSIAIQKNNPTIHKILVSLIQDNAVTSNDYWLKTIIDTIGYEVVNGSHLESLAMVSFTNYVASFPEATYEVINGDLWQTICFYSNITEPVNGSWIEAFKAMLVSGNGDIENESGVVPPVTGAVDNGFGYDSSVLNNGVINSGFGVVANTITGSGSGAQFQVNILGANWVQVVLLIGGTGYQSGDLLEIPVGSGGVLLEPIAITVGGVVPL